VGCSNAVNLTDGLDGLATGCTISTGMAYATLAYLAGHYYMSVEYLVIPHNPYVGELSVFLMGLVGAGGLGLTFFRQMAMFNYGGVTMVILTILALVILGEVVSHYLRKTIT